MLFNILAKINVIDWFSLFNIDVTVQGETMPLSEWCAQYSCVQTNFVMTLAGIFSIILLMIKKNKKWWWYVFFTIFTITSITSVGMHTANYGEFESGVLTTKLLGSYIDMGFCLLIAWSAVCCFIYEFCDLKHRRPFTTAITLWTILTILTLTIEVFVFKDRPLFIFGGGKAMDGASGGFSIAEFTCFLIAFPIIPIVIFNTKTIDKTEFRYISFVISIFLIAAIVSNLYGDNQINSFMYGNLHTHSLYHILNGLGTLTVVFWIDYRTFKQSQNIVDREKYIAILSDNEIENIIKISKKDVKSWAICTGITYFYVLLTFMLSIIAAIKGATGFYSDFNFSKYHFLIICLILFIGLNIIGLFVVKKSKDYYKIYKNNVSLYKAYNQ